MWECKNCGYKNSNSNKKCHGENCKAIREKDSKVVPRIVIKEAKIPKRIFDFCPVCKKDVVCIETKYKGKTAWRCTNAIHKPAFLRGKSKPFPIEVLERLKEEDRLKQMTLKETL